MQFTRDSLRSEIHVCTDPTIQLADSLARATNRAMLEGRISSRGGLVKPIAANCSSLPNRIEGLDHLIASSIINRDGQKEKALVFSVLALISIAAMSTLLWIWFDARRAA